MSNITINNEESQNEKQKTTPVTESLIANNPSDLTLLDTKKQIWLGMLV